MRLAMDVDGVLAEFTYAFTSLAQEMGLVEKPWGTSEQQNWHFKFRVEEVWEWVSAHPWWWCNLAPLATFEEIQTLNEVSKEHAVFFLTNRKGGDQVWKHTADWLIHNGVSMKWHRVILCDDKAQMAQSLRVDMAVDDNLQNLKDFREKGIIAVCRRQPYNTEWDGLAIDSLLELPELVTHARGHLARA